jgi:hypothetical protein
VHLACELVQVEAKKNALKVMKNAMKALVAAIVARCTTMKTTLASNVRILLSQWHCLQLWQLSVLSWLYSCHRFPVLLSLNQVSIFESFVTVPKMKFFESYLIFSQIFRHLI